MNKPITADPNPANHINLRNPKKGRFASFTSLFLRFGSKELFVEVRKFKN